MRDVTLYVRDILESMEAIESFVADMEFDAFMEDLKTRSAVVRQLEVMGEAAKMVPSDTRNANPDIEWRKMAGMRDRLIHTYFGVDYTVVWQTIKKIIPKEKTVILRIIERLDKAL